MIDLATYQPKGDKDNTPFFQDNLPRVYERRSRSGLAQLVGGMAAVLIQVEHGDAIVYMAELALMGPTGFANAGSTKLTASTCFRPIPPARA